VPFTCVDVIASNWVVFEALSLAVSVLTVDVMNVVRIPKRDSVSKRCISCGTFSISQVEVLPGAGVGSGLVAFAQLTVAVVEQELLEVCVKFSLEVGVSPPRDLLCSPADQFEVASPKPPGCSSDVAGVTVGVFVGLVPGSMYVEEPCINNVLFATVVV
jgi:hypothetical protein